ncbi:hypothetical protein B0H14DRAFT_2597358 [Mycena olivaceomarginata]|nr:hypothetical protein B0H14DRAFT_2597358 [Mycena olivaceomarginata]
MLPDLQLICHPPSNGGVVWRIDACATRRVAVFSAYATILEFTQLLIYHVHHLQLIKLGVIQYICTQMRQLATFWGRLDSLSQGSASFCVGSGSPWLVGYTDVMQISVDRCRISLGSSKPQPAYGEVLARLYWLSEPNPAAAMKRQYYKSFSAANQVASNTLTDLPWAELTSLKIQTAALTCPDLG